MSARIYTSRASKKESIPVYFKVVANCSANDTWTETSAVDVPGEGIVTRVRAILISGEATSLDFVIAEDSGGDSRYTVVEYADIDVENDRLDSEEEIYYDLVDAEGTGNKGTIYLRLKADQGDTNVVWVRVDIQLAR